MIHIIMMHIIVMRDTVDDLHKHGQHGGVVDDHLFFDS